MKKSICLIGIVFFIFPLVSRAELLINEIMYDLDESDTKREWVEIFNSGPEAVTIVTGAATTAWRFSDGSQHTLTPVTGSSSLAMGEYAIIADDATTFQTDWPSFSGILFDSSFSLNNTAGSLSLLVSKDGAVVSQFSYTKEQGAAGNGNSLQRTASGSWIEALPTPGAANASTAYVPPEAIASSTGSGSSSGGGGGGGAYSAHASPVALSQTEESGPSIGAGRKRLALVGEPVEFRATASNPAELRFSWSFGDGTATEGEIISHTYRFPGDYEVVLHGLYGGGKEAVSRTSVKVNALDFEFGVIDLKAGFLEIKNKSSYEANLTNWRLSCGSSTPFVFSRDTIMAAGRTLKIPIADKNCSSSDFVLSGSTGREVTRTNFGGELDQDKLARITAIRKQLAMVSRELARRQSEQMDLPGSVVALAEEMTVVASGSTMEPDPNIQTAQVIKLDDGRTGFWTAVKNLFKRN
ncbi:MAG: lamin tail domain-containing protein [Candidatus Vogelbacteria bacterium]|nr:lamin tail domain-containing protein [Candidatus Vogelbacteria bacterium]